MKDIKHTPGPWRVEKIDRTEANYEIQFSTDGECIAEFVHNEADAYLIAAAPALLSLLIHATEWIEESRGESGTTKFYKKAINKAITGE